MLFASHDLDESVTAADRALARRMLDERGLLPAEEFERRGGSASGSRPAAKHA
jgi:hypothetical protein